MAGIKCITCGGLTRVAFSAPKDNLQWRRRYCLSEDCLDRFSTYEVEATFLRKLIKRASIRYVDEGQFVLRMEDPELMLPKDAEKAHKRHAKFAAAEEKRKTQKENRKTHVRMSAREAKKLLQEKTKTLVDK